MWDGYFTLDGTEFINAQRTEAYAADESWFYAVYKPEHLNDLLGEADYTTPAVDGAPWYDPDVPESNDFYGVYPLEVTGLDDSSRSSTVAESTRDGGTPGRLRYGTKPVVFSVVLLARNEKGVTYGARWLERVLLGDLCGNPALDHTIGTDLTFLSSTPEEGDTLSDQYRRLRRFTVNSGPTITGKRIVESCGGAVWMATFTGVAGDPYIYGETREVLNGYLGFTETGHNYLANASFEDGATHWTGGTFTTVNVASGVTNAGSFVGRFTATSTASFTYWHDSVPTDETEEWTSTLWVRNNVGTRQVQAALRWIDDEGAVLSSTLGTLTSAPSAGAFVKVNVSGAAPVGAVAVQTALVHATGATNDKVDIAAAMLTRGLTVPTTFFDGSTPDSGGTFYQWLGEPFLSESRSVVFTTDPWSPDVTAGTADIDPTAWAEVECGEDTWEPLYDPLCPPLVAPPAPPSLPVGCLTIPTDWDRRTVVLPAENVPLWGAVAPLIGLSVEVETRNVRVRIYDDPGEDLDIGSNPCAFSTDLVVSYLPAGATMTIDMAAEEVWVETVSGQRRRADTLVFQTDSTPFDWTTLSCGSQQIITVDTEVGVVPPIIDLALTPRVR